MSEKITADNLLGTIHQLMHHEKGQPIVNEILKPLLDKFPNQEDLDIFIEEIIKKSE
jgi:hypothetical protein